MGIRVLKTAIAATLAVYFAWLLDLQYYPSAGILAILSVEVTRKRNLTSALQRFLASLLGIAVAAMLFEALGYHMWVLGLFIALSFPLLAAIHLKDGIVTGAVIVFHIFESQSVSVDSLWNECLLLIIGIGTATLINLIYMPAEDRSLILKRRSVEQYFVIIFKEIAIFLKSADSNWAGQEIISAEQSIAQGQAIAQRNIENHWFGTEHSQWLIYFKMREDQLHSIRQMLTLVAQVQDSLPQGKTLAELFLLLCEDLQEDSYTGATERKLDEMEQHFRQMPLPQTRQEFEIRSALFQLMFEMRRYLALARHKKNSLS